jgi:cell division protein FtsN
MREGMTEEQAVSELTRRNALGETLVEPKATEPMPREEKPESKITATAIPSVPASKTCPKCQRENKPTAQFCVQCGHRFV